MISAKPTDSMRRRILYTALHLLAFVAIAAFALLCIHRAILPLVAWLFPSLRASFFDLAVYGAYPTQSFRSFSQSGPAPSVVQWHNSCDNGMILVGPYGAATGSAGGPMILDAYGGLLWTTDQYSKNGTVMNLRVQRWKGENYLTFWAGEKFGFAGQGAYYMLDSSYKLVKVIRAVGSVEGDLHEFEMTEAGTALMTVYVKRQVDLQELGMWRSREGWIFDSMFQEINLETGDLLFEWKASEHFGAAQGSHVHPLAGYSEWLPFDFFHINGVQKDDIGNYLVSSRHLGAVLYINGSSGSTEWILGGGEALNDFHDLSKGRATDFSWQHDARWVAAERNGRVRILSLLDNASAGPFQFGRTKPSSQGLLIRLNLDVMTAELLHTYSALKPISAVSQGSMQVFNPSQSSFTNESSTAIASDAHVLVAWGSAFAYSEFALNGTLLCETHLAASTSFWWERAKSYRIYKDFSWVGSPDEPPAAVLEDDKVFVSWNGATEVASWELQGNRRQFASAMYGEKGWETVAVLPLEGFETTFDLPPHYKEHFHALRVTAMDHEGTVLHTSDPLTQRHTAPIRWSWSEILACLVLICLSTIGLCYLIEARARQKGWRRGPISLARASGRRFSRAVAGTRWKRRRFRGDGAAV